MIWAGFGIFRCVRIEGFHRKMMSLNLTHHNSWQWDRSLILVSGVGGVGEMHATEMGEREPPPSSLMARKRLELQEEEVVGICWRRWRETPLILCDLMNRE